MKLSGMGMNMNKNGKTNLEPAPWFRIPVPVEAAMANFKQHQI